MDKRDAIVNGPLGRNVLWFGLPLAIAMGLQATFNLADLFIIGKLPNGVDAIGALAICDMIAVIGTILCTGISNASVAVISRFFGANDRASMNHASWNSIFIILVLSIVFAGVGLFGAELLVGDMVGAPGDVHTIAVEYLQILVGNSWTIFFLLHLTAVMRALGSALLPALILIGANVLNVLLDILMVYGPGPAPEVFGWATGLAESMGIPRMGVNGAAWATVIARGVGCVLCMFALARAKMGPRLVWSEVQPKRKELWRLVKIGAPSSAQFVVRIAAVVVVLAIISRVYTPAGDTTVLAAFGICLRLDMLAIFMGMGWASAAQTFVGVNLGAKQPGRAIRAGWIASGFNAIAMFGVVAIYVGYSGQLIGFFSDQEAVITIGKEYLLSVGYTYAFIGVAVVLSNALQGATDTVTSFVIDAIVILGVQIPVLLIFAAIPDLPRQWIWYNVAGANVLSAFAYAVWYRRGAWTRREVDPISSSDAG